MNDRPFLDVWLDAWNAEPIQRDDIPGRLARQSLLAAGHQVPTVRAWIEEHIEEIRKHNSI